jgi:putative transposase
MTTIPVLVRSIRVIEAGGTYHVVSRGNDGRLVFLDRTDFETMVRMLETVVTKYGWLLLGYCLMDNHIHLLVQVPHGNLSRGMQELLTRFACYWNQRHGHSGHLFRNRFYSKKVGGEAQLIAVASYIDLNPVRARMRKDPAQWPWSSYRIHVGREYPPPFVANLEFLKLIGPTPEKARTAFERHVALAQKAVSDTDLGASNLAANQG